LTSGIKNKIIVTIEGKGRILIDDDIVENLPEKRSKNRRVDVVINLKPLPKIIIPGYYNPFKKITLLATTFILTIFFLKEEVVLTFKCKNRIRQNGQTFA
jgi:hypothetical protein